MFKGLLFLTLITLVLSYEAQGNLLKLTDDDFDAAISEYSAVLVKFYAPWCGHCKKLAPIYVQVADALAAQNSKIKIAEVDCTKNKNICSKYGIKGYPTVHFFQNGGEPQKYTSQRTKQAFITWLKQKVPSQEQGGIVISDKNSYEKDESVYKLTDDDFQKALQEFDFILIKFFAPWCGHCKKLAPAYKAAAKTLEDKQSKAIIAQVDCTIHKKVCSTNGIKGYPTLKMYAKGNSQLIKYTGARSEESIVSWVEQTVANHIPIEAEKKQEEQPKLEQL